MTLLFLLLFILFIKCSQALDCVSIDSTCLTCSSTHYENQYLTDIKLSVSLKKTLLDSNCILKLPNENIRNILILNEPCSSCQAFDKTYPNLLNALEEESRIAAKYLFTNDIFFIKN